MKTRFAMLSALALFFTIVIPAQSVPTTINYQGRLTDNTPAQTPITGAMYMQFEIWDVASGGTVSPDRLWREPNLDNVGVPVNAIGGIFNYHLGLSNPLTPALFSGANTTRYLQIIINPGAFNQETLAPRQLITANGYADLAQNANNAVNSNALGGIAASGWQRAVTPPACPAGQYYAAIDPGGVAGCTAAPSTPPGAVMFFNLTACPSGWSELTAARGRYLVGLPAGGTLGGADGTSLSDLEDRPVGQHNHAITDPGHTHSYINNAIYQSYCGGNYCQVQYGSSQVTGASTTGITVNSAGTVAGTNAPYLQLLVCQKN